MLEKLLIANRGYWALRIIRSCRDRGIKTVIVYSEADRDSLPVGLADETICIGPAPAQDSYLNISRILSAAEVTRSSAIHPGTGFLATDPEFADAVLNSGFVWVGPPPDLLRLLNDRLAVREQVKKADVAVLPGSDGAVTTPQDAVKISSALGLPVVVRPVAENTRQQRLIWQEKDIENQFRLCQAETRALFDAALAGGITTPAVFIEKFLPATRRIAVLLSATGNGTVTIWGETDISIARAGKNLIAESPAPGLKTQQQQIFDWANAVTRALNFTGVATVEFLITGAGDVYFHRFQHQLPEFHPLAELRYGIDLIQEQLHLLTEPEPTATSQPQPLFNQALACQIYAEDPGADFEPSLGTITDLHLPSGPNVRVDSFLTPGTEILPYYDLFLGIISAWAPDRESAIRRLHRALSETTITGIATNIRFLLNILDAKSFKSGKFTADTFRNIGQQNVNLTT